MKERYRHGFTLIELLVVIAIIAMIFALLMPTLSTMKRTVYTLLCNSNLRQIGIAMQSYVATRNGWYPPAGGGGSDYLQPTSTSWDEAISPFLSRDPINVKSDSRDLEAAGTPTLGNKLFQCPSRERGQSHHLDDLSYYAQMSYSREYVINGGHTWTTDNSSVFDGIASERGVSIRAVTIKRPKQLILFGERFGRNYSLGDGRGSSLGDLAVNTKQSWSHYYPSTRNYMFVDLHTDLMRDENAWNYQKNE